MIGFMLTLNFFPLLFLMLIRHRMVDIFLSSDMILPNPVAILLYSTVPVICFDFIKIKFWYNITIDYSGRTKFFDGFVKKTDHLLLFLDRIILLVNNIFQGWYIEVFKVCNRICTFHTSRTFSTGTWWFVVFVIWEKIYESCSITL